MPEPRSVLILGGTAEGRALAVACTAVGIQVLSSLAGRMSNPALPVGAVRIGGFGGVVGLTAYLREQPITAVVDATHPFAATISASAASACSATSLPLLRLARPGWSDRPGALPTVR
ncbi:precorrin-6x reductase [Nakamurella sp. UYEF19]